jgi:hypothetical protein
MDRMKAKRVLMMLDKLNKEIDLLGKILINNQYKPIPVRVKIQNRRKFQ